MEIGDDTIHPIQHVGNVPFGEEGNQTYIKNVLHVSTITKNMVSVGQIVEHGMQVRFNDGGCFIEKEGRLIARGRREGQMFILDSHEMKSTMYAKVKRANTDIELLAQEDRPHQSPEAQRNAVERSRHRTPDLYREGDCKRV